MRRINDFNELLYGHVIPTLFHAFYELEAYKKEKKEKVDLVRDPEGVFYLKADPKDVIQLGTVSSAMGAKSFHLDNYAFDSKPERKLFEEMLKDPRVKKVYFTGMLTHGQTDFYVQYIDPETHAVRSYYPDFYVELENGQRLILEVTADFQLYDKVVVEKGVATQEMARASGMEYRMVPASLIMKGNGLQVLERDVMEERQMELG